MTTAANDPNATQPSTSGRSVSAGRLMTTVARIVVSVAALVVLYVAAPLTTDTTLGAIVVMVLAIVAFTLSFAYHLRELQRSPEPILRAINLSVVMLVLFILGFALTYLALANANPGSFSQPLGKLSAVYFTVSVLATVGFGDITATTDAARAVVTFQMLSGLVLFGALVRYVTRLTSRRVQSLQRQD